mgnify:CR=1 FL=1
MCLDTTQAGLCLGVVQWLRVQLDDVTVFENRRAMPRAWIVSELVPVPEQRASFAAIVSPPYRRRTLMLGVLQILQAFGYYGFGTLVPTVLAAKGYSVVTSLTFTSLTFLGYPFGSALSLPIVERIDRRWLIAVSAGLMSVFGLSLGFATSSTAILLAGFLYTTSSNIFSNALHIFQVEIFPTFVRATATLNE